MRERGTGTIQAVRGGFRPRLPGDGAWLPVCSTHDEAERLLAAALDELRQDPAQGGMSLATYGAQVYDRREREGQRSARNSRSVFDHYVADSWIGKLPITTIAPADCKKWAKDLASRHAEAGHGHGEHVVAKRAAQLIGKQTAQNALNKLRVVLGEAFDEDIIPSNPAVGVKLPESLRKRPRTHETFTFLYPDEQTRLLTASHIPARERLAIAFSMGTGARQAEQWAIRLQDLDLANGKLVLRFTKNGKLRHIGLSPLALRALDEWLPMRAAEIAQARVEAAKRGHVFERTDLLWPTIRQCKRTNDPRDWQLWLEQAGLTAAQRKDEKHVRWHDLRHTCATSLLLGWWGRAWTLKEVQDHLGHSSQTTTERYAHIANQLSVAAAAAMRGATGGATTLQGEPQNPGKTLAPPAELESATFGLGREWQAVQSQIVGSDRSAGVARARLELATALVEAHQRGEQSFTRAEVEGAERLLMAVAGGEWEQPASQRRRVAR